MLIYKGWQALRCSPAASGKGEKTWICCRPGPMEGWLRQQKRR